MTPEPCVVYERRTGRITASVITCDPGQLRTGELDVLVGAVADPQTHRVDTRAAPPCVVALPPRPSAAHRFDYDRCAWVPDTDRAARQAREERDRLLAASDWTQLPDAPPGVRAAWVAYRQALRDVSAQPGFPMNIVWPDPP